MVVLWKLLDDTFHVVVLWKLLDDTIKPVSIRDQNWLSIPISAKCRSKVLQNAPREHSAILSTFIKLPFVVKTFVLSILSDHLRQVLLYTLYGSALETSR